LRLPHKPKGNPKYIDDNLVITFEEFDKFDEEAAALYEYLTDLDGSIAPITDLPDTLRNEIGEVLGSGNVVQFPKRPLPESPSPE
jgi:hypothetical protein